MLLLHVLFACRNKYITTTEFFPLGALSQRILNPTNLVKTPCWPQAPPGSWQRSDIPLVINKRRSQSQRSWLWW